MLRQKISHGDRYIWMHCSSAGEFEQGKPVAEAIKKQYPGHKLLLTFFSPSGYNVATNYQTADVVAYLPADTKKNAEAFLQIARPELAIFVKYEFWFHFLSGLDRLAIPSILISASFRHDQIFFKPTGGFFRRMLGLFQHLFVQDTASEKLLRKTGITHCSISGDTRFDRVVEIVEANKQIRQVEDFVQKNKCVVAGSTWPDDEKLLQAWRERQSGQAAKLIIAPHQINSAHLQALKALFPEAVIYSEIKANGGISKTAPVMIIDNVGMLSTLYRYATVTYVGGGFTRDGIHNILEAAVWRKPVLFGPNYDKYREAKELLAANGGYSIHDAGELDAILQTLLENAAQNETGGRNAFNYVNQNRGATAKILDYIQENRLLTS